jgi:hypothetical protein
MEIVERQIVIKPVTKTKFSGISSYSGSGTYLEGAQLGKGGYKTGLTKAEQTAFEEELVLTKGTLNKTNAAFWGHLLELNLPNDKTFYFNISTPLDELKYKVILEHSDIANNELDLAKNPSAIFYIEDKEAKAKIEELAIDSLMSANEAFNELTTDEKKGYLKLYNKKGVDQLSDRLVKTELYKEINKDPKKFLALKDNPDISLRITIEDMLEAGTLVKKGSFYSFEQEVIGNSIDSVVAFLKDVKNQSIKLAAIQVTKQAKKGK